MGTSRVRTLDVRAWAPLPTLLVCCAVLAEVVSLRGLLLGVVAGSVGLWAVVGALLTAGHRWIGWLVGFVGTGVVALAADRLGGSTSGPLARSSLLACGLVVAALLLARTAWPMLLLLPMLGLLGSAVALGSGKDALLWCGTWSVAAGMTLVMLGPYGSVLLSHRQRLIPLLTALLCVGLGATAAGVAATAVLGQPWQMRHTDGGVDLRALVAAPVALLLAPLADTSRPLPPPADTGTTAPLPPPAPPPPTDTKASLPPPAPPPPTDTGTTAPPPSPPPSMWRVLLAGLLWALVLWLLVWALLTAGRFLVRWGAARALWLGERRRLRQGSNRARVIGAWTWARLRLARAGVPPPRWTAPDVAVEWASRAGNDDLSTLAALTSEVAFNSVGDPTEQGARDAWRLADRVSRDAPRGPLRHRISMSLRTPHQAHRALVGTSTPR